MSETEIQRNRLLDQSAREAYYKKQNQRGPRESLSQAIRNLWNSIFRR